ncbi:hypothetical protein Q8X39_09865 [Leptothrix discophora]|uniref:Ribbon-helix-helix protein CopG domain-containing protein n=2 Tax=Leptothrix discophora TaxID=89 RepID=A0ABT9G3F3_LEPDI|nr:hypothetical protein [Leptothrix discophora]
MVDLRGIGDAVRSAAVDRGVTVAALARASIVEAIGPRTDVERPGHEIAIGPRRRITKLTLRLPIADAERLTFMAGHLGLSYGDVVARLVREAPLPQPVAEREADRAALLASNDAMAALSVDLHAFLRLVHLAKREEAEPFAQRLRKMDVAMQAHLDRASKVLSGL